MARLDLSADATMLVHRAGVMPRTEKMVETREADKL
jgi:hypothetical protein